MTVAAPTTPMVEAIDVRKSFGTVPVLRGVTFRVERGEVCCLLGPSGSGKSTLLRCINHLEPLDSGTLLVDGGYVGYREQQGRLHELREREICRRRAEIGMVFQHFNLFPHMTALQNVTEAPLLVQRRSRDEVVEEGRQLLERVDLGDRAQAYPRTLSGGQQQRVAIARALAMHPKLMLFDEPTSALDPELVGEVLAVIRDVARTGMTLIVVTHEIGFAREVADTVVFMDDGQLLEAGPPDKILSKPQHARTRDFLSKVLS